MRHAGQQRQRRRGARRAIVAACALACACAAHAQVSGSLGVVSDYRYRGYSLSDGDPALQASIAYDADSGLYGGLFASTVRDAGEAGVQLVPYIGFARRDAQGRSWDVGARWSHFTTDDAWNYAELHAGVTLRRVALRVHYAPDYFGQVSDLYAEADGSVRVRERLRVLWHVGVSHSGSPDRPVYAQGPDPYPDNGYSNGRYANQGTDRTRIDLRTGLAFETKVCDVQLTWQYVDDGDASPYAAPWDPNDRAGWVLGCAKHW
ncbi:TorF family putative porin [Lysobacter sp. KIS68-7]|uniref:TorF family putative porin n=1 Tax=Lysobacter sp. KIS68-7 TaxID=2904252 RepID=UPI001E491B91|nr:TorF family putative porin [Lysobacter sp. KIS68-7]UHQ20796.1 TorF family putative porin [Lysobacter sp. KIS68-7]